MSDHRKRVDVARSLRLREKAVCFHAGSSDMPKKLVEDKILSTVIEDGSGDQRCQRRAENARLKTIRTQDKETIRQIAENKKKEAPAERICNETVAVRQAAENENLPPYGGLRNGVLIALLAAAMDGAFMYWALCDTAGIDLTQGFGDLSALLAIMLALVSFLGVIVNSLAGFVASSPASMRRRLVGWISLFTIAITLGVMRAASTPETNYAFTIFGCVLTVVAGYFAGKIERKLLPLIAAHRVYHRRLALAQKAEAEAKDKLNTLLSATERLEAHRRGLRAEMENLAGMPARRAARNAEIEKIQSARLKAVRYYYALGQRFSGRTPNEEKEEVTNA
jgi:hypothetical protein